MAAGSAGVLATAARSYGVIALRPVGTKSRSASVALARYSFTPPMMADGKLAWMRRRVPGSESIL
eukprot:15056459-Alexandrium_andersonii.AAC.1